MTQTPLGNKATEVDEEPPPFFVTWRRLYTAVLIHLVLWILAFYFFTEYFHLSS